MPHATATPRVSAPAVEQAPAFAFPSGEMVGTAASAFPPVEVDGFGYTWQGVDGGGSPYGFESRDAIEGAYPRLHIAPGLLRVSYVDHAAQLRTRDRAARRAAADREAGIALARMHAMDVPAEGAEAGYCEAVPDAPATRGQVAGWSPKSRAALVRTIATLDLSPVVSGAAPPAMVTLTLPGRWRDVCPDGAAAADLFHRWTRAYRSRWGVEVACIWKREFQGRGAPHWHLWLALPTDDEAAFVTWLALSWASVVEASRTVDPGLRHVSGRENRYGVPLCSCSEYCRHVAAGTGVDVAEGKRARDPRRLATYFLKESASLGAKAYQNQPPADWEGGPVGRYWGVRGLQKSEALVPLALDVADRLWRWVQGVLVRRRPARFEVVSERVDPETGEVRRRRPVRRRIRENIERQRAGWVLVNDGPELAWRIARQLTGERPEHPPWW